MLSRYSVCGYLLALVLCATTGAQAQSVSNSYQPTGKYAGMPGQPGVPVRSGYSYGQRDFSEPANDLPEAVVVTAANDAPVTPAPAAEPAPAPVIAQHVAYHPPVNPDAEPAPPPSPYMTLETRKGLDLGVQVTDYRYRQPTNGTKISGVNYGGSLGGTTRFGNQFFGTLEGTFGIGWLDYTGSGDLHNRENQIWDARGLVGRDFNYEYFTFAPFTGIGYRHVDADLSGVTGVGTHLYERENEMLYLPLGFHQRFHIDEQSRFTSTMEYDFMLRGAETSHLQDRGAGDPTVYDDQHDGWGFKAAFMYETKSWSLGPFGSYWNVSSSKASVYHSPTSSCGSTTCSLIIPYNHTFEAGLQFKYHIF